jgi:hypothetical protein
MERLLLAIRSAHGKYFWAIFYVMLLAVATEQLNEERGQFLRANAIAFRDSALGDVSIPGKFYQDRLQVLRKPHPVLGGEFNHILASLDSNTYAPVVVQKDYAISGLPACVSDLHIFPLMQMYNLGRQVGRAVGSARLGG